jgi:hypothetical protein
MLQRKVVGLYLWVDPIVGFCIQLLLLVGARRFFASRKGEFNNRRWRLKPPYRVRDDYYVGRLDSLEFACAGTCRDPAATERVSEAEFVVTTTTTHICSNAYFMKLDLQGNISNGALAVAVGHPTAI